MAQVTIQVVNVNDNSPRFDRSFYMEDVSEGEHMSINGLLHELLVLKMLLLLLFVQMPVWILPSSQSRQATQTALHSNTQSQREMTKDTLRSTLQVGLYRLQETWTENK